MRRLNEFFYRLRWGRLEERRRRGLVRLHDLLAKTEFADRYWMIMGLLLGCLRDGAPIPWDRDSDFGFLEQDLPAFRAAMQVLRDAGYNLRPPQVNNDGRTTMWTFKYEAVKYDFFLIQRSGDNFRWHCHQRKPPLELVNEVPAHGLATFVLYDRQWRVPDNAEDLLTRIYGDWRRPNPDYLYWRDCRAIVERYPWTGERRPPD